MEEMRKVAEAYYKVAPSKVRQLARDFFDSMDDDKDKRISFPEFVAFMKQEGYSRMNNPDFFKKLSRDQKYLYFRDVMALYYIVKSGRPFCDGCAVLILNELYFICVECFQTKDDTFNLCFGCFRSQKFVHGHTNFLDNYALLESTRKKSLAKAKAKATKDTRKERKQPSTVSTSKAIVPAPSMTGQRKAALEAFKLAVCIGGIFANNMPCSIL